MTIPFIILAVLCVGLTIALSETWKRKEEYRCRVFELTKGKEGSNLVTVEPDRLPPPPPPKPRVKMYDEYKFINLKTCGDQSCLDRLTEKIQKEGYCYVPSGSNSQMLVFHKIWMEEIKED